MKEGTRVASNERRLKKRIKKKRVHVQFGVKSRILDATYVDRRPPHNLWSKNTNVKHVCDCTI